MGQYEGGRGLKWPKIGDVVYGWPPKYYMKSYMDIPFQVHMYLGRLVLKFEFLHTKINEAESNYRKRSSKKGPAW